MKRPILALVLLAALAPLQAHGQSSDTCVNPGVLLSTFDSEKITVSTSAIGFTASKYAPSTFGPALKVICTTETDTLRILTDGTAPTSSVGLQLAAGTSFSVCQADIFKFKAIRSGSSDVPMNCQYSRPKQ